MVELVPAKWTREDIKDNARSIMKSVGQVPVSMKRELPGFVLNRLQYALLNECFRLILDDVVSAEDLDVVMRDGLGLRYAFIGRYTFLCEIVEGFHEISLKPEVELILCISF